VTEVEERTADATGLIQYQQSGETAIETPFLITQRDPRVDANPGEIKFKLYQDGIYLGPQQVNASVWVTFRPAAPQFTAEEWSVATAYTAGAKVYYPSTGQCYRCIVGHTGTVPTDATKWTLIPFLSLLHRAVKVGAHAAMMREEGQLPSAEVIEAAMRDLLLREIERLELQSGQYRTVRMDGE
jgi:hypothetical protein